MTIRNYKNNGNGTGEALRGLFFLRFFVSPPCETYGLGYQSSSELLG